MAVHAAHLSRPNVNGIIGKSSCLDTPVLPNATIISTSTGKRFQAKTLRQLIHLAIIDIATKVLDVDCTIEGVTAHLDKSRSVKIVAIGPSPNIPIMTRKLLSTGFKVETSAVILNGRQHKLAIRKQICGGNIVRRIAS